MQSSQQESEVVSNQATSQTGTETSDRPTSATGPPATTRRSFLGSGGKKALYLTPVILTLAAREARAESGASGASGG